MGGGGGCYLDPKNDSNYSYNSESVFFSNNVKNFQAPYESSSCFHRQLENFKVFVIFLLPHLKIVMTEAQLFLTPII